MGIQTCEAILLRRLERGCESIAGFCASEKSSVLKCWSAAAQQAMDAGRFSASITRVKPSVEHSGHAAEHPAGKRSCTQTASQLTLWPNS